MLRETRGDTLLCRWTRMLGMLTLFLVVGTTGWAKDVSGATERMQSIGQDTETVSCEGDCDGGDAVTVDELITLVDIDLGAAERSACMNGVPSAGAVDIALILRAVKHLLRGCPLVVRLSDGDLKGHIDGGTRRFLGIPYAAAPVGDLRWRPPQPSVPWVGTRQASDFGPSCSNHIFSTHPFSFSEDCLYLNVWTPNPAPTDRLPVMVWFHGGGNQTLDASEVFAARDLPLKFNGRTLAATRNVIVVTINYRLGVFGFFSHPELAEEDPAYPYAGNQGLLDQRAALQWVRDNIVAFGGDPDNVTIFGESAGSLDVCLHVVSPGSAGLFHRAISESNGCTTRQATAADAAPAVEQLVSAVGCSASPNVLTCLRQVPAEELLSANPLGDGWATANLIIDGAFLPDQPRALFAAGAFSKVPYILGSNAEEGNGQIRGPLPALLDSQGGYLGALRSLFGERAEQVAALYPPEDFPPTDLGSSELLALARVIGDRENVCPTYDTARRAAAGGADVYLYNFARPDPEPPYSDLGPDHLAEIGYVFGSIDLMTEENEEVARAMQGYWTRLAHTGDPNGEGAEEWPRYEEASDERITFDVPISVLTGFRRTECEFWWTLDDEQFE